MTLFVSAGRLVLPFLLGCAVLAATPVAASAQGLSERLRLEKDEREALDRAGLLDSDALLDPPTGKLFARLDNGKAVWHAEIERTDKGVRLTRLGWTECNNCSPMLNVSAVYAVPAASILDACEPFKPLGNGNLETSCTADQHRKFILKGSAGDLWSVARSGGGKFRFIPEAYRPSFERLLAKHPKLSTEDMRVWLSVEIQTRAAMVRAKEATPPPAPAATTAVAPPPPAVSPPADDAERKRLEAERREMERQRKALEAEREKLRLETERLKAQTDKARSEAESARRTAEREAKERAKHEKELKDAREAKEREEKARREAKEKAEREAKEREERAQRAAKEKADHEAKEREERAQRAAKEKTEREAREKEAAEKRVRESTSSWLNALRDIQAPGFNEPFIKQCGASAYTLDYVDQSKTIGEQNRRQQVARFMCHCFWMNDRIARQRIPAGEVDLGSLAKFLNLPSAERAKSPIAKVAGDYIAQCNARIPQEALAEFMNYLTQAR